jgi:UDP-glucose 6-dehydrogenase
MVGQIGCHALVWEINGEKGVGARRCIEKFMKLTIFGTGCVKLVTCACLAGGNHHLCVDVARADAHAKVQLIAVCTPPDETGPPDLQYIPVVVRSIENAMVDAKVVAVKPTVPVGASDKVQARFTTVLAERKAADFDVFF